MNARLIKLLKIILPLSLGVFLIWYSISPASPEERQKTWEYIAQADIKWVVLSLILGIISHLSRAYRWQFLLTPLGYSVKLHNSFMAVMAGYLANLGIPRSGEVLRGGIVTAYENIPFKKAFGTIISERVIDLIMLSIIVVITVFFESQDLFSYMGENISNPYITLGLLPVLVVLGALGLKILRKSENKLIVKIRDFGEGIFEGIKSVFSIKKKKLFIFHTMLIWGLYVLMFYVIKYAVPETSDLSIGAILVAFVAGTLAMSLTNGGIGAFPLAIAYSLILFDVDESAGKAFGWILWGSQTAINVVVGALSFLLLPIVNRGK